MHYASGHILTSRGFEPGHIGYEDGMVVEVGEGAADKPDITGYILPTFINAHTHLADLKVCVDLSKPLEDVVAPPNGLKHRYLATAPPSEIRRSLLMMSRKMARNGTSRYIDFREGGAEGAKLLRDIGRSGGARPFVMGRPDGMLYDREGVERLLRNADGVGVSSITDWDYEELRALSEHVRRSGKPFALHASERFREDIDKVLDLKPAFLVHMTKASKGDLEKCRESKVPIVVCPRSNLFFGSVPPLADMVDSGVTLALGTDNAMMALPDMICEMEFAARILRSQGAKRLDSVLDMAVKGGRIILNEIDGISIKSGSPCDFMVLRSRKGDPMTDITLRSGERDVRLVCVGDSCWRGWR